MKMDIMASWYIVNCKESHPSMCAIFWFEPCINYSYGLSYRVVMDLRDQLGHLEQMANKYVKDVYVCSIMINVLHKTFIAVFLI